MAGHQLIDDYLDRLARDLPAGVVEELADGLCETWRHQVDAGRTPALAARAAITEFGTAEQVVDAFVRQSPDRRTARLLLVTGPLVGACWGVTLGAGQVWTWPVPPAAAVLLATALAGLVVTLAAAATAKRSYRRARLGAVGALGLIAVDLAMVALVLSAAPTFGRLLALGVATSLILAVLTAGAVRRTGVLA
jgi:hypothetical protein